MIIRSSNFLYLSLFIFLGLASCQEDSARDGESNIHKGLLFKSLSSSQTGVNFVNEIDETWERNGMQYDYFYYGGGVGIGDINNDDLPDLFFSGNDSPNRLYLNKGNMQFEDITETALPKIDKWCTGVNMIDINLDGLLDIYVCTSGPYPDTDTASLTNILYLNQGDLRFTEEAEAFGLDIYSRAVQSSFFDQDGDGDLDLWLSNHGILDNADMMAWSAALLEKGIHKVRSIGTYVGKNVDGYFVDNTQASFAFFTTFGLGIAPADYDDDGDVDMYIANDYFAPDMFYINDGKGRFKDDIKKYFDHTSFNSKGVDAADINNDDIIDLAVVDMNPKDHLRNKTLMPFMDRQSFKFREERMSFVKQFMSNTIQLGVGFGGFSEVAQYMGVSQTDWSWAVLLADFDNDGFKDYFVSNGFYRETKDRDFKSKLVAFSDSTGIKDSKEIFENFVANIESVPVQNNVFSNNNGERFIDKTSEWFEDQPSFSQGTAYGDLDNDGDLDLVINNLMSEAFVLENKSKSNNWLRVKLLDPRNPSSVDFAKIKAYSNGEVRRTDYSFMRGYQSSMEPIAHMGLGTIEQLDSLVIVWADEKKTILQNVESNQVLEIDRSLSAEVDLLASIEPDLFLDITYRIPDFMVINHRENDFDDFQKEVLLPHKYSDLGPAFAVADINGDGFDDFYLGGGSGHPGQMFFQSQNAFKSLPIPEFKNDSNFEDLGAVFFDVEGDGDLDLYVASGGGGDVELDALLRQDRIYLNQGNGLFEKDEQRLPYMESSTKTIVPFDYDLDGDMDLFVGARNNPGLYPLPSRSYLLENDKGYFNELKADWLKEVPGMVTGAEAIDLDNDGRKDLVIVGEWEEPTFFKNTTEGIIKSEVSATSDLSGWWQSCTAIDIDKDGDMDLVLGNIGENNKYQPTVENPLSVFASDFDLTGTHDIVLTKKYKREDVLVHGKDFSTQQLPFLNEKFKTHQAFASSNVTEVLGKEEMEEATQLEVTFFKSIILKNNGNFNFEKINLPGPAQWGPIASTLVDDFNKDGHMDLVIAGAINHTEAETMSYDAGKGIVLYGNGDFGFEPNFRVDQTGLLFNRNVRDIEFIKLGSAQKGILVANNNSGMQLFFRNEQ